MNLYIIVVSVYYAINIMNLLKPMKHLAGLVGTPTVQIPFEVIILVRSTIFLLLLPLLAQIA